MDMVTIILLKEMKKIKIYRISQFSNNNIKTLVWFVSDKITSSLYRNQLITYKHNIGS